MPRFRPAISRSPVGSGDDYFTFDRQGSSNAGLTISDNVDGGDGDNDTLAIEGNQTVSLGASEFTNVENMEILRLIGNTAASDNSFNGTNAYNITLTNEFVDANARDGNVIDIINDNDPANDTAGGGNTAGTAVEVGATIDARSLNAQNAFSYDGEEGASATPDRFILTDATINGRAVIDGGAADNNPNTPGGNNDVLEARNAAVVTLGDLENVQNVGQLEFTNDTAVDAEQPPGAGRRDRRRAGGQLPHGNDDLAGDLEHRC